MISGIYRYAEPVDNGRAVMRELVMSYIEGWARTDGHGPSARIPPSVPMSRTRGHGTAGQPTTGPGAEWWGRRPLAGTPKGSKRHARWFKRRLHKLERRGWRRRD
jgi:hypothetical protein